DHLLEWIHDPIDARAIAIGDGTRWAVIVSVESIGLFENQTKRMQAAVRAALPAGTDVTLVFSADHNESSPDSIGLFGAPDTGQGVGVNSGIDDYYMAFLVDRAAEAALAAFHSAAPGRARSTRISTARALACRCSWWATTAASRTRRSSRRCRTRSSRRCAPASVSATPCLPRCPRPRTSPSGRSSATRSTSSRRSR